MSSALVSSESFRNRRFSSRNDGCSVLICSGIQRERYQFNHQDSSKLGATLPFCSAGASTFAVCDLYRYAYGASRAGRFGTRWNAVPTWRGWGRLLMRRGSAPSLNEERRIMKDRRDGVRFVFGKRSTHGNR